MQMAEQYNLTTIMVTHDPEEALTMSDRALILKDGRITQFAAPQDIIQHPPSQFIRDFILRPLAIKRDNIYALFGEGGPSASRPLGRRRRGRGLGPSALRGSHGRRVTEGPSHDNPTAPAARTPRQRRLSRARKRASAILVLVVAFFCAFLALPAAMVLIRSFTGADGGASLGNYAATFADLDFLASIANSLTVSCASALVATGLAFLLSCTVNCTNVPAPLKRAIGLLGQLPMLLPTITYGFAIIYTFGRQACSPGPWAFRHSTSTASTACSWATSSTSCPPRSTDRQQLSLHR